MQSTFMRAWLLCGTLDALYATIMSAIRGTATPLMVWQGVAAGPFGDAAKQYGLAGGLAGLGVHFGIMAAMVAVFVFAHARSGQLRASNPWLLGTLYGLLLYGIMYCIVLAWRYPGIFPQTDPVKIAIGLFPHIFFVGIPLALMARRHAR